MILQWEMIHNDPYFVIFITHLMLSLCVYALNTLSISLCIYRFHLLFSLCIYIFHLQAFTMCL